MGNPAQLAQEPLMRGSSAAHYIDVLVARLHEAAPADREEASWAWVREAFDIGMNPNVARAYREAIVLTYKHGLPT